MSTRLAGRSGPHKLRQVTPITIVAEPDTRMQLSLEVTLLYGGFPYAFEIWDLLGPTHPEYADLEVLLAPKERKLAFGAVGSHLRNRGTADLSMQLLGGRIEHGDVSSLEFHRLDLMQVVRDLEDAERWVDKLLQDERFVQARLYDHEYDHWQNAEDLTFYSTAGRSIAGLPLKSNGRPYPLTRQIVDIDANPGRWRLRRGYIESIGATMWLGEPFWRMSGAKRESIRSCHGVVMTELAHGVTRVGTSLDVFRSADGVEGDLQRMMRAALFGC